MVGTSYEMLLITTYIGDAKERLGLTWKRIVALRHRIQEHNLTEEYLIETLTKLGCRCIRPRVELPCIVQDKNGRQFDEYTYVKMFFTPELAEKYHVDYRIVMAKARMHQSINRPLFKHLLKSRRAWIVLDSLTLDSIWSYEPIEMTMTEWQIIQVRNMLASHLPVQIGPYGQLLYNRGPHDHQSNQDPQAQDECNESRETTTE